MMMTSTEDYVDSPGSSPHKKPVSESNNACCGCTCLWGGRPRVSIGLGAGPLLARFLAS